jgi:hypothetical protein
MELFARATSPTGFTKSWRSGWRRRSLHARGGSAESWQERGCRRGCVPGDWEGTIKDGRLAARVSRVSSASVSSSLSSASEDASSDRDTFGVGIGRHALKGARPLTSSRKASSAMIRAGGGRRDCGGDEACVKLGEGAEDLAHDGGVGGRRRVDEPGRDQQEWNVRSQKILARWTSGVRKL